MALSFKKRFIAKIISGEKTATRRIRKPMVKPGGTYRLKTGYRYLPDSIRVQRVYAQRLGDITESDVFKEGYNSLEGFRQDWIEIYKSWIEDQQIWVIEFEYLGVIEKFKL